MAYLLRNLALRMFGQPRGLLGRLGGRIMARTNADAGAWVSDLLEVGPKDRVLEVGFGPGVTIERLEKLASEGRVAGVDASAVMVEQARARNGTAIRAGHVDLRQASVDGLPFTDQSFNRGLAINSMQVWPDPVAGLREIRRVLTAGGRLALGFTLHSGQHKDKVLPLVKEAGFVDARLVEREGCFCVLARRP